MLDLAHLMTFRRSCWRIRTSLQQAIDLLRRVSSAKLPELETVVEIVDVDEKKDWSEDRTLRNATKDKSKDRVDAANCD